MDKGRNVRPLPAGHRPSVGCYGATLTTMVPEYRPACMFWKLALVIVPVTVNVLSWPAPRPEPAPVLAEVIVGVMVVTPQVPAVVQVTVAVAGTVKIGAVPLVHRYRMAAAPVALVAELGSILLPTPVLVMLTTGATVKNLQTGMIVALTVTVTLPAACALPAANMPSAAAADSSFLNVAVFIACFPQWFS